MTRYYLGLDRHPSATGGLVNPAVISLAVNLVRIRGLCYTGYIYGDPPSPYGPHRGERGLFTGYTRNYEGI